MALGPEVHLDGTLLKVFAKWREFRRATHPETGIRIPAGTDPVMAGHILAIDKEVMKDRAKRLEEQDQEIKAAMENAKGMKGA